MLDPDDDHLYRDRGQDHAHEAGHDGAHRHGQTRTDAGREVENDPERHEDDCQRSRDSRMPSQPPSLGLDDDDGRDRSRTHEDGKGHGVESDVVPATSNGVVLLLLLRASLVGAGSTAVEHGQGDDEQDDSACDPEVVNADAEEPQDCRAEEQDDGTHEGGGDRCTNRCAPLGRGILVLGETQEQGQVDKGVHDREKGSQGLDQHSNSHIRIVPHTPAASRETKRPSPDGRACG